MASGRFGCKWELKLVKKGQNGQIGDGNEESVVKACEIGDFWEFWRFLRVFGDFCEFWGRLQKKQANGHAFSATRVQVNWSLYLRGKGGNPGVVLGGGEEQKRAFLRLC